MHDVFFAEKRHSEMKTEWRSTSGEQSTRNSNYSRRNGLCTKTKDSENGQSEFKWKSWECVKRLYAVFITSLLFVENGAAFVFSSPLLDEMLKNANSTRWVKESDSCVFESLIAPSVLIGSIFGSLSGALVPCLLGLASSLVAVSIVYLLGWSVIGTSWFISSPSLFRGLILTGRFITGAALGFVSSTSSVRSEEFLPTIFMLKCILCII